MRKSNVVIVAEVALAFSIIAVPMAFARGPGGHGFAGPVGGAPTWQSSNPPGFSQGVKTGWHGGSVPPGWNKGKKAGWNGLGAPPGLYGR